MWTCRIQPRRTPYQKRTLRLYPVRSNALLAMSVLFDWKIRDIESIANECKNRLWELNALRSDVERLEHTVRENRTEIDGLRAELQTAQEKLNVLEYRIEEFLANL